MATPGAVEEDLDRSGPSQQYSKVLHKRHFRYMLPLLEVPKAKDSGDVQEQLENVRQIQANYGAFAAIIEGGSVVTWGISDFGGDSSMAPGLFLNTCA